MSEYSPVLARRGFRLALFVVAVTGVVAAAAGAFVLSYPGTRDTAVAAGVSAPLARVFPAVMDAAVVVAGVAAVTLRGVVRGYAWLVLLVTAGAVAAADAARALSVTMPKRPLEATVASVPWAALLISLTLLYAMGRQALPSRRAAAGYAAANGGPAAVPLSALLDHRPARPATVTNQAAASTPTVGLARAAAPGRVAAPEPDTTPRTAAASELATVSELVPKSEVAAESDTVTAPEPAAVGESAAEAGAAPLRRVPRDDPSDPDAGAGPADQAASPASAGDQPAGDRPPGD